MENHTNSTTEFEIYGQEIFERFLPVIVIMLILGTFGIIGNIVTLIFYTKKCKRNSTSTLISFLAVMDTFVCILIITSSAEMVINISNDQRVLCKIQHAVRIGFVGSSVFSLMLIAIDRYRKICLPFKTQMTQKFVKYAIFGTLVFFFLLGTRNLFTFDTVQIEIKQESGEIFNETYCTFSDHLKYKTIGSIFNYVDFIIVSIVWITIIPCYSLIANRVIKLRKKRKQNENFDTKQQDGAATAAKIFQVMWLHNLAKTDDISVKFSYTDTKETDFEYGRTKDKANLKSASQTLVSSTNFAKRDKQTLKLVINDHFKMSETDATDLQKGYQQPTLNNGRKGYLKRRPKKTSGIRSRQLRLTFMLLIVSIVFILCFLPYFAVIIVATINSTQVKDFELDPLQQIALRLPLLNSTFNPFIYLLFNGEFRAYVWIPFGVSMSKLRSSTMHF